MSKAIKLSPKHGLNCSIVVCPICKKDTSLALFGRLKDDAEAPKQIEGELCDECKKKYITVIEVESEANRISTGRRGYIPKEAISVSYKYDTVLMTTEEFTKYFVK